ncbi:glycosyltransferase [Candidatus Binatus soli]|jgi:glycosyltransferase involved in cell wall biosynthesis|uniref:glycosyltransferase n=1 Tax=Candidatus Binatus soli TaxID=1953413 RepID=UPI003D09E237
MRILLVSEMIPCLPSHDGFRLISANLIRNLFDRHEIHLIALSRGDESEEQSEWPRAYCQSVSIFRSEHGIRAKVRAITGDVDPALTRFISDAVARVRPDVLHLEGGGLAALLRSTTRGLPGILCVHDSKALRCREFAGYAARARERFRLKLLSLLARRQELRWFGYADRVVVTSPSDAQALSVGLSAERIAVIPNGVDLEYFAYRPAPEAGRIVFTGNMSWPPNEDAAEHFARDLMPAIRNRIPGASFWIVGAQPSLRVRNLSSVPGIHVTGTVADIRPWIWSAAVYASPLRFGLGVKNKILEAMASGAPIVATSRSLSGTPLIDGRHAMIADDDAKFGDSVARLLADPALRESLSREARRKAEAEYSWRSVATKYEEVYREALAQRDPPHLLESRGPFKGR